MDVAWLIPVNVALILQLLVNDIAQESHFKYYCLFEYTARQLLFKQTKGNCFFSMNYDPSFFLLDKTENRQKVMKISQLNELTMSFEDKSIN